MPSLNQAIFIVADLETTGLSPDRNRITEIAVVRVEGAERLEAHSSLVNPGQHIPTDVQRLTGITNAMAFAAPAPAVVFPDARRWFDGADAFVAHNAQFDFTFLSRAFSREGLEPLRIPMLCTARLARRLLPARKGWSLVELTSYLGIRVRNRHRASGDVAATARALIELIAIAEDEYGCESLEDLIAIQRSPVSRFRDVPASIRSMQELAACLPATPGVYRILDRRKIVLYVGKAKSLRERVSTYFRASAVHTRKIAEMVRRARAIEFEETGSELAALLLESRLIKGLQPKYNTMEKRYRRLAFLRLDTSDPFPRLALSQQIEADGAEYFGPFAGRQSVEVLLEILGRLFGLRECEADIRPNASAVPCLYGQMGRCLAPCNAVSDLQGYAAEVERLRAFLSGGATGLAGALRERMEAHAAAMEFEEAAAVRDQITQVNRLMAGRRNVPMSVHATNVVIVLPPDESGRRQLFMIRSGRLAVALTIGRRSPRKTLQRLMDRIYRNEAQHTHGWGREEIDEIRIIAAYLGRNSQTGTFVWIQPGESSGDILDRVIAAMDLCRAENVPRLKGDDIAEYRDSAEKVG